MADSNIHIISTTLASQRESGDFTRKPMEKPLAVDDFKRNFTAFVKMLESMFADETLSSGILGNHFLLDEVSFVAEVGPNGDFHVRGDCGPAGGGVRFVIRRRRTNSDADNSLITTVDGQNEVIITSIDTIGRVGSVDIIKANNLLPTPLVVAIG